MKRIEIIGNQELMAELEEKLWAKLPHLHYTILNVLAGKGRKGQARGDGVWPTINFYCVLLVENGEDVKIIQDIVKIIKHDNTVNALKAFVSEGNIARLQDYKPQISAASDPVDQEESLPAEDNSVYIESDGE